MKNRQELIQAINQKMKDLQASKNAIDVSILSCELGNLYRELGIICHAESIAVEHNKKIPS
jgi:hypothetical protein